MTACSISGAAISLAQKPSNADAETAEKTKILLPSSYEQYLDLTAPTDVAVCEDYTAIADGNTIYVYDRYDGVYREYVHNVNADPLKNNVTKLQFNGEGDLFFLDATYLYVLNPNTLELPEPTVTNTNFPCTTFYLHNDMLYFTDTKASTTQLSQLDLLAYDIDVTHAKTLKSDLSGKPTITVYENELYYTSSNNLKKINLETENSSTVAVFDNFSAFSSIRIVDGVFCCTSTNEPTTFYAYDLADLTKVSIISDASIAPLNKTAGEFSALSVHNGSVYAVDGNSIREFNAAEREFTDYEIGNKSASAHRINEATETYLAGNLLLIADNGNKRISVLDTKTGEFLAPIANTLTADYLVADGNTVLVANQDQAILYSMQSQSYGALLAKFDGFIGNIIGAASVYGSYYLALDNYCHYHISADETGKWTCAETRRAATRTPFLLTADAYGNLYLASGTKIHRYTEEQFLSASEDGEEVYGNLSTLAQKIMVDYEGNLYALVEGKLFKLGEENAYELNAPLVYTPSVQTQITSFAFGIEENKVYTLYAENYLAETEILNLPTVKTIAVNGADESIFAEESASFSVVQTKPHALTVYFDIHTLKNAEIFPYLSFERRPAPFTALKIGETDKHNALAIFNESSHEYQTCLVLKTQCDELPAEDYRNDYPSKKIGYLSNAVSLYKFPYLNASLTVSRLEAGAEITLLGEIDKLDHPYYQIEFTNENGVLQTGFIPKAYVTDFDGTPPTPETVVYGSTANNNDAIFRLCYLLLGFGVICILFDVLILHKPKNDDEEK